MGGVMSTYRLTVDLASDLDPDELHAAAIDALADVAHIAVDRGLESAMAEATTLTTIEQAELEQLRADREALDSILAEGLTTMHLGMLIIEHFGPSRPVKNAPRPRQPLDGEG